MRLLSWNVRGLGGLEKRKEVRGLLNEKRLCIVCIQETKLGVCDDFFKCFSVGDVTPCETRRWWKCGIRVVFLTCS
jgi:hypothetical protein